jgi:hypothetical protein
MSLNFFTIFILLTWLFKFVYSEGLLNLNHNKPVQIYVKKKMILEPLISRVKLTEIYFNIDFLKEGLDHSSSSKR